MTTLRKTPQDWVWEWTVWSEVKLQKNLSFSPGMTIVKAGDYEFVSDPFNLSKWDILKVLRLVTSFDKWRNTTFVELSISRNGHPMTWEQSGVKNSTIRWIEITVRIALDNLKKINSSDDSVANTKIHSSERIRRTLWLGKR